MTQHHDQKRSQILVATHARSPGPDFALHSTLTKEGQTWRDLHGQSDTDRFATAVIKALVDHATDTLLVDDQVQLTGLNIMDLMAPIKAAIEELTPVRGRVGIVFPNSAKQGLALLTTIISGRVPVLLPPLADGMPLPKNLHAVMLPQDEIPGGTIEIPMLLLDSAGELARIGGLKRVAERALPRRDTAMILYTSGSNGEPKGVELSAAGLMYTIETLIAYFGLNTNSVATMTLPMFHTMAVNTQFLPTFFAGGRCVFIDVKFSLGRLYRSIKSHEGTFVSLIGDMLQLCAEEKHRRDLSPAEHVTHVQLAGGIIRPEHLEAAAELFPKAKIHKGYGLTEAIRVAMISSDHPRFYTDAVGRVLNGQSVQIRDAAKAVLPAGMMGEIWVKGPNVMLGYDAAPSDHVVDGWLATGDTGYLTHDGYLMIHGRLDGIFKSQGRRIATKEIEHSAVSHEVIRDAKCIPVPCMHKGLRPILFVEVAPEKLAYFRTTEGRSSFESSLSRCLDTYKIPRDIFVCPAMPRTATGKIRRTPLEQVWQHRDRATELGGGSHGCRFRLLPNVFEGVHLR